MVMTDLESPPPRMTPYGSLYERPQGLVRTARAMSRNAIRSYGTLTARWRVTPDYLIIGTKRGGTTSLARWMLEHPDVRPLFPGRETRKGTYYFDVNYRRGERWYRSHFPTRFARGRAVRKAGRPVLVGEATPYYLHHPHAAIRARRFAPEAKVIVLLRDPAERAYSHWVERTRNRVEHLSFADAVAAEPARLAGAEQRMIDDPSYNSFAHQHFSYLDQGRYARGLRRWMSAFPAHQLLVLRSEDMYADPSAIYGQVLDFLGLPPHALGEFDAWNMKPKQAVEPELMAWIRSELAADVGEVEALLGRSMEWT